MSLSNALIPESPGTVPRWVFAAAYVLVFLALDWVSFIRPYQGLNITPWNPQPALAIALLLWRPSWLALVWASALVADVVVRGWPDDVFVTLVATAALTLSYGAIARLLRLRLDWSLALATRRDLAWFTASVVGGALASGTLYVGMLAAGGLGPEGPLVEAIARYWIGDAVGLLVVLPVLLAWIDRARRHELVRVLRSPRDAVVIVLVLAIVAFIFTRADREPFKFFYLLFLPVVWSAVQRGLAGAVLTSVVAQVGLIAAVQAGHAADLTVFELQVLMAALTMTGLTLGVVVDERRRAEAKLEGSLRMAAAGQMAAALAHELSQPLTALNSYAKAARLIESSTELSTPERLGRLTEVAARMADDALRASDVVKRLRDFFLSGSTQLRRVDVGELVGDAMAAAQRRAQAQGIQLHSAQESPASVMADPVQMAVVMRNLLANAMDAVADGAQRDVRVAVRRRDGGVTIEVHDSGPGVDALRLQRLFDPGGHGDPGESGGSGKPGAMGIGLSLCRAIVEAHGGRLWAEPGPKGLFCLTLPLEATGSTLPHDAS